MSPHRAALEAFLKESRARVDRALSEALPDSAEPPAVLHEAMRYAVLSGGKRLRPALAFGAARALELDPERALPVAVAVELVHAYSLVHDDLPAMDDDAERRGRPTVHVEFGEGVAVLVGDALLTAAFGRLAEADVPPDCAGALVGALAAAAGSRALVGGQVDDLRLGAGVGFEDVCRVHARKTAALFEFATSGAARLCRAAPAQIEALGAFGRQYGMAFQAADDHADSGRDETSLLQVGSEEALRRHVEDQLRGCVVALESFGEGAAPLRALAGDLAERIQ